MMLSELLPETKSEFDVTIEGLTDDSRAVRPGYVFCAVSGEAGDGRDYINDAVDRGAVAILCDPPGVEATVPVVAINDLRAQLGTLAGRVYGDPSTNIPVIAVTGTNGKTSFANLLAQALGSLGRKSGLVGTMGHGVPGMLKEPGLTTPPATDMQRRMKSLVDEDCQAIVLEASSHGLVQGRLEGLDVDTAVLTNISHDHLDYHLTFADYRLAKQRLFELASVKQAVVNVDDELGADIARNFSDRLKVFTFSQVDNAADVRLESVEFTDAGIQLALTVGDETVKAQTALFGGFNVENLMAVATTLTSMGISPADIGRSFESLTPVAGRMDIVAWAGKPTLIVDYAHTPDALEKALKAVREHFSDRHLCCVFGCGGDRDASKRPLMGEIAARYADRVIVTSDNPRSEDPAKIIEDILCGMSGSATESMVDREEAIRAAVTGADVDDVILVAGKGHETYQELATGRISFSDHDVIRSCFTPRNVILGLGGTGVSYARHLTERGEPFTVLSDSASDDNLTILRSIDNQAEVKAITEQALAGAEVAYVSPGVPLALPQLRSAKQAGLTLRGDVQMFGELANAPIVAITGTNGKSTVAQLVYELASAQQAGVFLGGNIGKPCLEVLDDSASLYVLEVSSYQLELATALKPRVAVVLNLSPDHLDRYDSQAQYYETKLALYRGCESAVVNREINPEVAAGTRVISFGPDAATGENEIGLAADGSITLGGRSIVSPADLVISGKHNLLNAQAALAIGMLLELNLDRMIDTLKTFRGLAHRSEVIAEIDGVSYINDSKATNIGAMVAAIEGESDGNNILLIAGGDSKGADFTGLGSTIAPFVKHVCLIGESAEEIAAALEDVSFEISGTLDVAIQAAGQRAGSGDVVLFAPGCASFDQFDNYRHRGDVFRSLVEESRS